MNDNLPDRTIILIILCTLLIVFSFIFSFKPSGYEIEPSIQWKDATNINYEQLQS